MYAYAFAMAGAVQCLLLYSRMVMSAKGLIDVNPDPTRLEVIAAIRNNICRCTGYKKIIDGILLSARIFRENLPVADNSGHRTGRRCNPEELMPEKRCWEPGNIRTISILTA